jgi:sugar lactone lactonase YvrE
VGLRRSVCLWTPDGPFEPLAEPEPDLPDNRLNEGKVAPDGSFWVGTMQDNLEDDGSPKEMDRESGAYYRIDPNGAVSQLTPRDFGVTNTMIWLGDGRFVGADTAKNELYVFEEDPVNHHLTAKQQFGPRFERGLPDGSTPDSAGGFWNCRVVGGGCVIRLDREGDVDRVVDLPCSSPTSCAFGGPDLSTLYVTSSRFGMPEDHLATNQHEGGLFSVDAGMTGVPEHQFAG